MTDSKKKLNLKAPSSATSEAAGFKGSEKSGQAEEKLKVLSIKLPEHLHRKLKTAASQEGTTITQKITDWIQEI